jgi:hypothetical protein
MIMRAIALLALLAGPAAAQTNYQPFAPSGSLIRVQSTRNVGQIFNVSSQPVTCFIFNPIAVRNGIAISESIFISVFGSASYSGSGPNSIEIPAGKSLVVGPTSQTIIWTAVTTNHSIAGYCQ